MHVLPPAARRKVDPQDEEDSGRQPDHEVPVDQQGEPEDPEDDDRCESHGI